MAAIALCFLASGVVGSAQEMRPFSITELRRGGYTAAELSATCYYTLGELRDGLQ